MSCEGRLQQNWKSRGGLVLPRCVLWYSFGLETCSGRSCADGLHLQVRCKDFIYVFWILFLCFWISSLKRDGKQQWWSRVYSRLLSWRFLCSGTLQGFHIMLLSATWTCCSTITCGFLDLWLQGFRPKNIQGRRLQQCQWFQGTVSKVSGELYISQSNWFDGKAFLVLWTTLVRVWQTRNSCTQCLRPQVHLHPFLFWPNPKP